MKRHYTLSGLLLCLMTLFTLSASAAPDKNYLCFTAEKAGTVSLRSRGTPTAVTIEYSTDNGASWTTVDLSTKGSTGNIALANIGDKVYFRNAEPASNVTGFSKDTNNYYYFTCSYVAASGNVMSLVDKNCETTEIPCEYCFYSLFSDASEMTSAPELPATTLAANCYRLMFENCKALTSAPELPATTLANSCYSYMFSGCKALTTAPELPATTLANYCYMQMFTNCSNLKDMKVAFTAFNSYATNSWVDYVVKTGTFTCPGGLVPEFGSTYIPYSNSYKWTVKNTYDLTFGEGKQWASMCVNLPLQVPAEDVVEVYYASAASGSTITLTQIEAGTVMAAKTAVIVKGAKGTVSFPVAGEAGTSYSGNLFQGSSVDKACNAGENYVLNASMSSDTSVHFSIYTGTTLSDHKAWLPMSAVGGASSIQFRFADATAISTVETEPAEDVIYNLAGQRVGSDYRGLVIKNGKKVFNK